MYKANAIEAFHRQSPRVIKTKGSFTSDTALLKLLYLALHDVKSKWCRANAQLEPHIGPALGTL